MKRILIVLLGLCFLLSANAQFTQKTFEYSNSIIVSDGGQANPYPINIPVSDLPNYLSNIRVSLFSVSNQWSLTQFDMVLEAPDGQLIVLLSDVGPYADNWDFFSVIHIDADGISTLNESSINSDPNFYLPSNEGAIDVLPILDTINQPNPTFADLQNTNPNGSWKLYIVDDNLNFGIQSIINGWSLTIEASNTPICERPIELPQVSWLNRNKVAIEWTNTPGSTWDIFYAKEDTLLNYNSSPIIENYGSNSIVLEDLDYEADYSFYLRRDCAGNNEQVSRWNGPLRFTTDPGLCAYALSIELCQGSTLSNNSAFAYESVFYDPCEVSGSDNLKQFMYNYSPPASGDYYISVSNSSDELQSVSIRAQDEVTFCDSVGWTCLASNNLGNVLVPNLQANVNYKLLLFTDDNVLFKMSQCPELWNVDLDSYVPHAFDVDFSFSNEGAQLEGNFDIYYAPTSTDVPDLNTNPTLTNVVLNDGKISTPALSLEEATNYDLFIRSVCVSGRSCWYGPFEFKTDQHCGDVEDLGGFDIKTTATTSWIQISDFPIIANATSYIVIRDSLFGLSAYEEVPDVENWNQNFSFQYGFQPNTTYTFYVQLGCSLFMEYGSQYWQGPYTFTTNESCFVDVEELHCGQCYKSDFLPVPDSNIPLVTSTNEGFFPGNNPQGCFGLDYDPKLEKIYIYNAQATGELVLQRGQWMSCGGSEYLAQFYYKSASLPCDLEDWQYLGCWNPANNALDDITLSVEKDSSYHILLDYYGSLCNGGWLSPSINFKVAGEQCLSSCPTVTNLTSDDQGNGIFKFNWDAVPGAITYEVIWNPSGQADPFYNSYYCLQDVSGDDRLLSQQTGTEIFVNIDNLVPQMTPGIGYSLYVRARCGPEHFGFWTEILITPDFAGSAEYFTASTFGDCGPTYDRTTIEPMNDVPYDYIPFTVNIGGNYIFEMTSWSEFGAYAALYEDEFLPESPTTNLLFEGNNSVNSIWDFEFELSAGKNYYLVCNFVIPEGDGPFKVEINGPSIPNTEGYFYEGGEEKVHGNVPPSNGIFYQSNRMCIDRAGWRNYYYSDPSNPNGEDYLLFSIENYEKIEPFNSVLTAHSGGSSEASYIMALPSNYVEVQYYHAMKRYWDVQLFSQNSQPDEPVSIRFYYTDEDLQGLRDATDDQDLEHTDLTFFKINDPEDSFDINPATGHIDIPAAEHCADIGAWEYYNAPFADTTLWTYGTYKNAHYAEMKVHAFSGGGGGNQTFKKDLLDSDGDGYFDIVDCNIDDPNINPGAFEIHYDGIDNDCNANTSDDDADGDGYALDNDCNDMNAAINPGNFEIPYDGLDNDCNVFTLDDDLDEDGFLLTDDCDDMNAAINPSATEIPNNGIDEDCDGSDLVNSTTHIPNSHINIYPNPTDSKIFIEESGLAATEYFLYDVMGQLLQHSNFEKKASLSLQNYPAGLYIIKIQADKGNYSEIVVKH